MASSSLARLAHVTDALLPQPADAAEEAAPATVDERIMIPTRDEGVRLSCLLSKPSTGGAGPWPCLLTMHYGGDHPAQGRADMALAGFVVADVVFRGCYHSEGMADGGIYVTLANDGFDVCEWLAAQEWCDGQVGSFGGSQGGFAQNLLASTAPPSLVCQYQQDTGLSLFHEAYRHGGGGQRGPAVFGSIPTVHRGLEGHKDGESQSAWADHPHYDDYWAQQDATQHLPKNNTPCCTIGSWHDFMCQGSVATFVGKQRLGAEGSKGTQTLICGPWTHGGSGAQLTAEGTIKVGEHDYPSQAAFPFPGGMDAHQVQYFRQQMGLMSSEEAEQAAAALAPATVQYYVMGAVGEEGAPGNEWRYAPDFPLPAIPTPYFLHTDGVLQLERPAEAGSTPIVADPAARADNLTGGAGFPGGRDARGFEAQDPYVKSFTTEVLTSPVEWTGAVHAEIFAELGAKDCDIIVRVSDVYPDGRSMLIADCHRRASFRAGLNLPPTLLEPGDRCKVVFRVGWMSQNFNAGHRIRVTVSCTGLPLYETGGNGLDDSAGRSTHSVLHGAAQPSCVLAPVIPSGSQADCVDMSEMMMADLEAGVFPA